MDSMHEQEMTSYLQRVATGLRAMPDEAREAELEEIGQHLQALMQAHTEVGLPEKEAIRAALRQFGEAAQVARTLVRAWKRGRERLLPGTLQGAVGWGLGANLGTVAAQIVLQFLFPFSLSSNILFLILRNYCLGYGSVLLTGYITGRMAPRYAPRGAFFVWLTFQAVYLTLLVTMTLPHLPASLLPQYMAFWICHSAVGLGIMLMGTHLGRRRFFVAGRKRLIG